jgi:DNA-binding response OmpR family regulator
LTFGTVLAAALGMTDDGRARILVADDEPAIRRFVEGHLRGAGYDMYTASSGEEVVALADLHRPDLVVLDVEMPDMDGLDACHRIRAIREDKPTILFITGHRDETTLRLASVAGGEDLLPKPFSSSELLHRAAALLEGRRLARERSEPKCSLVPRFANTDARELLDDVVTRTAARLRLRDNRLRAEWDPRVDWIWVDGDLLSRVLENLIEDACDCSPPGSQILIDVDRGGDAVDFRVRARGWAIPQELKFCERAVRAHGGRLWIESDGPDASCFHVAIPTRPRPADREDRSPADEALPLKEGLPC